MSRIIVLAAFVALALACNSNGDGGWCDSSPSTSGNCGSDYYLQYQACVHCDDHPRGPCAMQASYCNWKEAVARKAKIGPLRKCKDISYPCDWFRARREALRNVTEDYALALEHKWRTAIATGKTLHKFGNNPFAKRDPKKSPTQQPGEVQLTDGEEIADVSGWQKKQCVALAEKDDAQTAGFDVSGERPELEWKYIECVYDKNTLATISGSVTASTCQATTGGSIGTFAGATGTQFTSFYHCFCKAKGQNWATEQDEADVTDKFELADQAGCPCPFNVWASAAKVQCPKN